MSGTNTDSDGRFHSKWLNMMYSRLYLARNLLSESGVIFISIDDSEHTNLRRLCDEIFGEENFRADIAWQKRYTRSNNTVDFTSTVEHIVVYARSSDFLPNLLPRTEAADARYANPDGDTRGPWKGASFLNPATPAQRPNLCYPITNPNTGHVTEPTTNAWRRSLTEFTRLSADNRLYWGSDGKQAVPVIKMFLSEGRGLTPINFWSHDYAGSTDDGTKDLADLFDQKLFDNPKPVLLVKRMLEHGTESDSIVLDFFAGSGTTAQAVMELNAEDGGNRKFMLVQLPEPTGRADFPTISEITRERTRRAVKKLDQEVTLVTHPSATRGFKAFKLDESNFTTWDARIQHDSQALTKQLDLHINHIRHDRTSDDILYEILLKSGFPLTTRVEKQSLGGKTIYCVAGGALVICLERELTLELIRAIAQMKPERVVCLDEGFASNDQLKTNAVQTFKTNGITSFKTV